MTATRVALAVVVLVAGIAGTGALAAGAASTPGELGNAEATVQADRNASLDVRTFGAPRAAASKLHTPANVTALRERGRLVNVTRVPLNSTLVVALDVPGLAAELDDAGGANATVRFRRAVRAANVSLAAEQTNPGPSQLPVELELVNASATRVVPDEANDTYYLVVNLTALNAARDTNDSGTNADRQLHGREEFRLNLSVPGPSRLSVEGSAEATLAVERREASVGPQVDGELRLPASANATVAGATTLLAGTEVTVRLRVGDDGSATTETRTVTVTQSEDHNRYAASFDLSGAADGTPVSVQVEGPTGSLLSEREEGLVVEPIASVELLDDPRHYDASWIRVHAEFTYPGFVVVREGDRNGPVVGVRALAPGSHTAVRVYLDREVPRNGTLVAVAVHDVDGDREFDAGDPAFVRNGSAVSDAMTFAPTTTATTTSTTTATATTTSTTTASDTTTSTTGTTTGTSADGQPGFGVGAALLALAAALVLGRR